MNALVMGCTAAMVWLAGSAAQASETILLNPNQPPPRAAERQAVWVESLDGKTRCELTLVPNGVLQFTAACTAWPLVMKSKQWSRQEGTLRFLDPEGRVTIVFYKVSDTVYMTGRADPEFLRLTILPPPPQFPLQPSIPLKP